VDEEGVLVAPCWGKPQQVCQCLGRAISGLLAIAGGIAAFALIRRKDFVVHAEVAPPAGDGGATGPRRRRRGREPSPT